MDRSESNYKEINVENALEDQESIFYYYQKLIKLRKENEAIVYGNYDLLLEDDEQIYAYTRTLGEETLLVICSFTAGSPLFTLPSGIEYSSPELLISNYPIEEGASINSFEMKPFEARVYKLN